MIQPTTAVYGTWQSPITAAAIVTSGISLGGVALAGDRLYWLEGRPAEGGRNVLVARDADGTVSDVTPPGFNIRTRVHEYGGGACLLTDAGTFYFVHFTDQRLYVQRPGESPSALTPENACRYADMVLDQQRDRLICVCEDHRNPSAEPVNTLATIDLTTGAVQTLVSGSDFYSSPRLSPDGQYLAWLSWQHPQMPWDGTQLWVAPLVAEDSLGTAHCLAGGEQESICAPSWSPDGQLYFVSDRSNWWNLYHTRDFTGQQAAEPLFPLAAEFGYPHWVFGIQPYQFAAADTLFCTYSQNGQTTLARLDIASKNLQPLTLPFTSISSLQLSGDQAYFIGGSPTESAQLVQLDLATQTLTILKRASELTIDPGYLSVPQAIEFPTEDGQTAYAWFYPPQNQDFTAPTGDRPPLLVRSHGGPTAAAAATFNLRYQYWTSRGWAVLDVNYGGSTGYGRAYRQRLQGQWGLVDVADCANAAQFLATQGWVDGDRLAIAGGSAGGYTTLAALTFRDVFKAGASYYGVSDLAALAQDTHKFEARYLDGLIGPYPEAEAVYTARSPIHHAERLSCPVIFFQGLEDKIVPPNQAERMVEILQQKGIPVAYVPFAAEQHGFRRAENIQRALESEFYFYARIFGFQPADELEPVEILNLDAS
ncbi:MAG: S9 family peptidase [Spirulinaceae cyanobacterium SM2_1_0]|nr:S9 family peptidase [Spirulinaceae cyanobacterium SM2_1_0]